MKSFNCFRFLALMFAVIVLSVSCQKSKDDNPTPQPDPQPTPENAKVIIHFSPLPEGIINVQTRDCLVYDPETEEVLVRSETDITLQNSQIIMDMESINKFKGKTLWLYYFGAMGMQGSSIPVCPVEAEFYFVLEVLPKINEFNIEVKLPTAKEKDKPDKPAR